MTTPNQPLTLDQVRARQFPNERVFEALCVVEAQLAVTLQDLAIAKHNSDEAYKEYWRRLTEDLDDSVRSELEGLAGAVDELQAENERLRELVLKYQEKEGGHAFE